MIVNIDGIPVYQAILNTEEDGMIRVSLVDEPAVLRDFQAFKDQKPRCLYKIEDEEQRRVFGVVMRADFPIYRRDEAMKGEYYIQSPVNEMIANGSASFEVLTSSDKWFGVTYKEDKPEVMAKFAALKADGTYPVQLWD